MTTALSKFSANVRRRREELGFTQEGFAQHAKLDRAFYGRIERGKQNISHKLIAHLSYYLQVRPAHLFSDVEIEDCAPGDAQFEHGGASASPGPPTDGRSA